MTEIERKYFEDYTKIMDSIVPDFKNQDEELEFYNSMKVQGLKMADNAIKKCGPALQEIKIKFGADSEMYKVMSDEFVKLTTDFIFVEINPNTLYIGVSDIQSLPIDKILGQNQFALSLLNKLENFHKGEQNKIDIKTIKNKISAIEAKFKPNASCYIATIIFHDYNSKEVCILREYRDLYLNRRLWGKLLINLYYNSAYFIHPLVNKSPRLQKIIKKNLGRFIMKITNN